MKNRGASLLPEGDLYTPEVAKIEQKQQRALFRELISLIETYVLRKEVVDIGGDRSAFGPSVIS